MRAIFSINTSCGYYLGLITQGKVFFSYFGDNFVLILPSFSIKNKMNVAKFSHHKSKLFTSLAGATNESDVGVGTIVGSAVFNLLGLV